MQGIFIIAFVILAIVFGPLVWIWGINTLFPVVAIPYTFWTWLAALLVGGSIVSGKRGK